MESGSGAQRRPSVLGSAARPTITSVGARRRRGAAPYLLLLPALLVLAAVLAYPLATLLGLSFQHYGLRQLIAHRGEFVGLDNYRLVLGDRFFWAVVLRTAVFTVVCVVLTLLLGTLIALLMERVRTAVRVALAGVLVLVWATPVVVAIDVWQWMFDYEFGVANWVITRVGVAGFRHHNWFYSPVEGFSVITAIVVWGALPFVTITLFAALTQVPRDLVQAAQVDGAGSWHVFRHVTLPVLRPLIWILASLSTIWDFQVFNQVWILLNSRPSQPFYLMAVYSYVQSFRVSQYGLGATIATLMVVFVLGLTAFYVRRYLRELGEGASV